jgi:CMP/dCMP kinase
VSGFVKVVTIDGPAGSGKSTVAKMLAAELGWQYVTTGAIYRTLGLMLKESGALSTDDGAVERFVSFLNERYRQDSRSGRVFIGEREVTNEIRSPEISEKASVIAQNETVRQKLLHIQRKVVTECNGAVVDGRDMGTIVFPDSPLKIFLTASPEERAKRRLRELHAMGQETTLEELVREIHVRDERDSTRKIAPMVAASDAVLLDSSTRDPQSVVSFVLELCVQRKIVPSARQMGTP